MCDVYTGDTFADFIGLRHDCDNVIEPAVHMAEWEAARGYRSTYFILHTAPYWHDEPLLRASLERIAELGHEIGIHSNAVVESVRTGAPPAEILSRAIEELRGYGFTITGTVAHGDPGCYDGRGRVRLVNDEMWAECVRDTRAPERFGFIPIPLAALGLEYDANWLPRGKYLSDSGGQWSAPGFDAVAAGFPYDGQLHVLQHPDWWGAAFVTQEVAA
jgi:hypothetical protein